MKKWETPAIAELNINETAMTFKDAYDNDGLTWNWQGTEHPIPSVDDKIS